ncbi:hypothetical protein PVK06_034243 [Gossypium arboreum]|uniref:RNase H type-1 domain-containing protein n=1 Tax=Gossypium arboreum TaxID=29729 RepID=A0ABR0NDN0_GOSAR|nr:hypothetical protein PVK06_034243 [Gossypium arboreum]
MLVENTYKYFPSKFTLSTMYGTVKVVSEDAAVGGVIRDDQGRWILGFNRRLCQCFVFNIELWDILDGLLLLQNRHCDKVLIRTDIMKVLQDTFTSISFSSLNRRIHQLLQEASQ